MGHVKHRCKYKDLKCHLNSIWCCSVIQWWHQMTVILNTPNKIFWYIIHFLSFSQVHLEIIRSTHLYAWRGQTLMCCPLYCSSIASVWTDTGTPWCPSSPPLQYKPCGPDRAGRASSDPEIGLSAGCTEAVLQWCTSPVSGWGSWLMTWESKTKASTIS